MKRLLTLLLLIPNIAWGATYYVRPVSACPNNGDGTAYACAASGGATGAWSTFANVLWNGAGKVSAGDTLKPCGTFMSADAATAARLMVVGTTGTSTSSRITIDGDCTAQGSIASAILDDENIVTTACVDNLAASHVTIKNVTAKNCTSATPPTNLAAVQITGTGSDVIYDHITVSGTPGVGINCSGNSITTPADNIVVSNFNVQHTGAMGVGALGPCTNAVFRNGYVNDTGSTNSSHGMSFHAVRSTITSGWTLVSGNVYSRTISSPSTAKMVIVSTSQPYTWLTQNLGTPTTPGANEFGTSGTTVYVNLGGTNPNTKSILVTGDDVHDIAVRDVIVLNSHNGLYPSAFEGHGIAADDGMRGLTIERAYIDTFEGVGVSCNKCSDLTVRSSVIVNGLGSHGTNGEGVYVTGKNVILQNNTIANNVNSGVHLFYTSTPHTATVVNNVVVRNGATGLSVLSNNAALTASNNDAWGNTTADRTATYWVETGGLSADPLFVSSNDFRLTPTSPAIGAGTCYLSVGCIYPDFKNHVQHGKPNIGAYGSYVPLNRDTVVR